MAASTSIIQESQDVVIKTQRISGYHILQDKDHFRLIHSMVHFNYQETAFPQKDDMVIEGYFQGCLLHFVDLLLWNPLGNPCLSHFLYEINEESMKSLALSFKCNGEWQCGVFCFQSLPSRRHSQPWPELRFLFCVQWTLCEKEEENFLCCLSIFFID